MAQKPSPGPLPCLFCGKAFRNSLSLTAHLDLTHENWVTFVMDRLGMPAPEAYPIEEYRRALAEVLVGESLPATEN